MRSGCMRHNTCVTWLSFRRANLSSGSVGGGWDGGTAEWGDWAWHGNLYKEFAV
ncbi:MAG TPA: hypothetical protein VHW43_02370 [Puia sp.]|nr:hypothetical protein [Puia sp.]